MTFVVLGVLAIVWIVVLGSYARERFAERRTDSVSAFHSQLSTLQRTNAGSGARSQRSVAGRPQISSASAMACAVARQRRKNVLLGLLTVALLTVIFAVAAPGLVTIGLALVSVAAFTGYVILLVERQRIVTEQHSKVRPISSARPRPAMRQTPARQTVLSATRR